MIKTFKYFVAVFLGYADSFIFYNKNCFALVFSQPNADHSRTGRVLDGIGNQVDQYLLNLFLINTSRHGVGPWIEFQLNVMIDGMLLKGVNDLLCKRNEIDRCQLKFVFAALYFTEVNKLVD